MRRRFDPEGPCGALAITLIAIVTFTALYTVLVQITGFVLGCST